jgi:hypothetical protein
MFLDLFALLATTIVLWLYGAGLRRPFGSLRTISQLSASLRQSRAILWVDWLYVAFITTMSVLLIWYLPIWQLAIAGPMAYIIAENLAHRIKIVPSFYIAGAMALACIMWVCSKQIIATG